MAFRRDRETAWERRLNICTGAAAYGRQDANHAPYEPTSYAVLERLARSGLIGAEDTLVDYGCGKGRVGFFMCHAVGCRAVGVEYDEKLWRQAEENRAAYAGKRAGDVRFVCDCAENYRPDGANRFYFFNPFSGRILDAVLARIVESYYGQPQELRLFFYYAMDDYRERLMTNDMLALMAEIDCRDLFDGDNPREKILVFRIGEDVAR